MNKPRFKMGMFLVALMSAALGLTGCGGSQFAGELSARPRPQAIGASDTQLIQLPGDRKFSIHLAPSSQQAGLEGQAEANASADRAGDAQANASVQQGGTASAAFQLGHAFKNTSGRQIDLHFELNFSYSFDASATPDQGVPDATVGLKLYARDQHNRLLTSLPVVLHSTEDGDATSGADRQTIKFSVTLGPGSSANVFLAGYARIDSPEGRSAQGSVELRGLTMRVQSKTAPAVRAVGDEQG